jgi:hypothetical protein
LYVWGKGAYAIMLGAGAFVHKKYSYVSIYIRTLLADVNWGWHTSYRSVNSCFCCYCLLYTDSNCFLSVSRHLSFFERFVTTLQENLVPLDQPSQETRGSSDIVKMRADLQQYLKGNAECSGLALPLWAAKQGADRPTWVEASPAFKSTSKFKKELERITASNQEQKNRCLTDIMALLQIEYLPQSKHKSTRASNHIIW